ncbi:PAS domain S-box protein [Sabulilitoribacter multivorans]|uniref:histidine kinase n=1 Tax=Flaviramulus multivorans TaxID=1304750 RepID=A0ABS9IGR3_9FLAO|nr:PAS domain-containing protein [Flaviramulus multivorans]MCF7559919.1 PAS domain S-box protein [Flaviramulus multivorans]
MEIYATIIIEFILVISSILILFKLRSRIGLAPLYIVLGALQFLQANLGTSFSFRFFDDYVIYPGSIILFSGLLFAVLLIYIKEGVASARALIIGVVISNVILSFAFEITHIQQVIGSKLNNITTPLYSIYDINFKYLFSGTAILFIDFLLIAILYQYLITKFKKLPYFIILFISLWTILMFDAFAFNLALFYGTPTLKTSLFSHVLGKSVAATLYALTLYLYIKYLDGEKEKSTFIAKQERDIFSIIKYRKQYEDLKIEKAKVERKLTSQLETTLHNISDGFVSLDTNWCYTYINNKAAEFLGKTPESLLGKHIWTEFPDGVNRSFYKVYYEAVETQRTIYFEDYYEPMDKWFENRVYPSPDGLTIYFTDITEQKKAGIAVKESENHIRTILETEPECIKQLNRKGELLYMNPAGLEMIEADNLEMVKNQSVLNLVCKEHQMAFKKLIVDVFEGQSRQLIFQIKGIKGTKRWLETHSVPFRDTEGKIISLLGVTRDVTARREADTNNLMLLSLLETSDDFIGLADLEGKPIYLNANGRKLVGLDENEKLPESISDFFPVEYHDTIVNEHMPNIFTKNKWKGEAQFKSFKTGDLIPIEMSGFLIHDSATKKPMALGIVATDVSKRKQAEEDLKNSELLFRRLTSSAPVGIFQTDKEGSCNYVNEEWLNYAGMSFHDALGFGWSNAIYAEDRERVVQAWQQYVLTGGDFNIEFRFQNKKNNNITWISVKAVETYDANNNLYGYIGMTLDITKRKEIEDQIKSSEKYLDNIINNIGDPVFVKDHKSRLLLVNDAFCEIFNLSREDVIGKTLAENVPPEERESFLSIDKHVISTGIENINEETLTLEGKETKIISTKKTRFIDSKNNKFLIGIIRDITDRKKAEVELENHRNNLEELVEKRTEEVNLKNEELQRMNKLFVGRELRMKELKNIIKDLQDKNEN